MEKWQKNEVLEVLESCSNYFYIFCLDMGVSH